MLSFVVVGRGWRSLAVLPLMVLLACSSPSEPGDVAVAFEVLGHLSDPLASAVEVDVAGALILEGSITSPCVPYDAHARARTDGTSVTLTVIGEATGSCPMDAIDELSYRAMLTGLSSGKHMVRVVHTYADANWPDLDVLNEPVIVP